METSVSQPVVPTPTHTGGEAESGIYVYSIIECAEPRNFGRIGIGGRGSAVFTVQYKDLAAVVSHTPLVAFDPTRENVLAHEHVNKVIIEAGFTPVPLSFGTLFKTEKDAAAFLEDRYEALHDVLIKLKDKLEFGLRVNWAREEALADTSEAYVRDIFDYLGVAAIASRSNKPIGDKMIMNAAFLVEREAATTFDQKVQEIAQRYEGELSFRCTGPWPPYNFITIRLQPERSALV